MIEQLNNDLHHKSTELHFIIGAINNLKQVQLAQEGQTCWGLSRATGNFIDDLCHRTDTLQRMIVETKEQMQKISEESQETI